MPLEVTIENSSGRSSVPTQSVERSPPSGIDVIVVGGGPAGVYAALSCWRKGHNVRIIERSPVARTQGDFFTISPHIVNHIHTWPEMVDENEEIAIDPWFSYHKITGERLGGPEPFNWALRSESQQDGDVTPTRMYRHHRPKFLQMLISQLGRVGVEIEYGNRVVDYYENGNAAGVLLDDGRKLDADVVIAADGVGTKSHKLINGHDIRAWSSGWASFRAAFPVDVIAPDQEINERFKVLDNGHPLISMWHGQGLHMIVLRTDDVINWGMMHRDDGTSQESWQETVNTDVVFKYLLGVPDFPDFMKRLIRATPDGIVDWKLMLRNPQSNITSPLGRVVQVGDAAHTYLPSSGSGANQGIEDTIYLATCLELGGKDNINWATKVHNKLRFERVSCCQKVGFINFARRNRKESGPVERTLSNIKSEHGRWMWGHDPEKYVYENYSKALDHLKNGAQFLNTNIPPGHTHEDCTVDELLAKIDEGESIVFNGDWS
ncbi:putative FAD-binding domain-containing protein [Seiridium unicorne]|uniref:FAD-binding domain-containing protein n=1 Tax=Seiridium unicorne TaxID=138068 RepID=A0ABR2UEV0_9PEZI